jgi:hypothetical protein
MGSVSGIPESEIRKIYIPDPGVKKAPDSGSRSATLHQTESKLHRCHNKPDILSKQEIFYFAVVGMMIRF